MTHGRIKKHKRVFITGGAGYVGSALVPYLLDRGYEVTVYDLYIYGDVFKNIKSGNLKEVKGDIRDREKIINAGKNSDVFIHLACISNDPSFELNPELGKSINYDAFFNVMESARKNNAKRFIYASTSSVYGLKEEKQVTEDVKLEPLTDYSKYKAECEKVLAKEAGDMNWSILRPATICGYAPRLRLDLVVNIFTIHALENKKIKVFGGTQTRPNINIKDMVRAYALFVDAPIENINHQAFNVGHKNLKISEIAGMVKNLCGDAELENVPTDDKRSYHINSEKISTMLGFKTEHTVADGITSIVDAYNQGLITNGISNPIYHNIKRMEEMNLK